MFDKMLGDMEERQKEMKTKLSSIIIKEKGENGKVIVEINANREITNITIDPSLFTQGDAEQLEDILLITLNRALQKAADKEMEEGQNLVKNMLPGGLGGLSNLFGS